MTKQELFDKMVEGLAAQGWEKSLCGSVCAYRGEGGLKCAVGHLLTDEEAEHLETYTVCEAKKWGRLPAELLPHVDFLAAAQAVHDSANSHQNMRLGFIELAEEYGLNCNLECGGSK